MNTINCEQEIIRLKAKITDLEERFARCIECPNAIEQCIVEESTIEQSTLLPIVEQGKQNELFSRYNLCEANWVTIPEGVLYHSEQVISAFKMLATPITFEMFDVYCAATNQQPPGDNGWGRENRPVINVNLQNVMAYTQWLSEQTGWHCQLPTEQQWEYACRANTVTHYWYGDVPDPRMMVMGTGKTMPTPGHRMANPWDLYDMHGNVWEWTLSNKGDEYILCGGSWYNKVNWLTSTARNISYPNFCNNNWGFRIIRELE
jgi:hypothetical protein